MSKSKRQRFVFVGERRSLTAIRRGWRWQDGRLAAKPLFEALESSGIDPKQQQYVNLWSDTDVITWERVEWLRMRYAEGATIVALGKRVGSQLVKLEIEHVALVHPAARGRIRKRERYIAHVSEKLGRAA